MLKCGVDSVVAGTVCLDAYEASVWRDDWKWKPPPPADGQAGESGRPTVLAKKEAMAPPFQIRARSGGTVRKRDIMKVAFLILGS